MRRRSAREREQPGSAWEPGFSGSSHPRSAAGRASQLTKDRPRSRVPGGDRPIWGMSEISKSDIHEGGGMPVRSHVDLGLFVVFLHVPPEQVTPALLRELDRVNGRQGERFDGVEAELPSRVRQVIFHEHYHFWQGLRLPFVFRYAFLSTRLMFLAFQKLVRVTPEYHDWDCVLPQLELLNMKTMAGFKGSNLYCNMQDDWADLASKKTE